jgi:transglutaminase-like putative cysteine protease/predicted glutamine amidotransferase
MSQLLALSFDADSCPSIHLEPWTRTVKHHREMTGWGFAWYPNSAAAAMVIKDPIPTGDTPLSTFLRDWDRFQSTIFLCHMRGAAKRTTHRDTHPFSQTYAGYDWLLAHNGDLDPDFVNGLPLSADGVFLPMGSTDSERVLCWLLDQCRALGARRLADLGWDTLNAWLRELNQHGTLNLLLSDGRDVVAYRDATGFASLHLCRRQPPHEGARMSNGVLELHLDHALDANRTLALVASTPLEPGEWHAIPPGDMVVLRRGAVVFTSGPELGQTIDPRSPPATAASTPRGRGPRVFDPTIVAESRVLRVSHDTVYRYEQPVTHSTHVLRLKPSHAPGQDLLAFGLDVSVNSQARDFEDVFGNQSHRLTITEPYTELRFRARSLVRVDSDMGFLSSPADRLSLPLMWMPWQRQMMLPYLLPPELPESQLMELVEYAQGFAARQDNDLIETLVDINESLYRDFQYLSGSTTLMTTPFDVYVERKGVCQDFANLFICLARLLSVPARYRVGYIHTGAQYDNKVQSEASHAWVEIYLPWVGWKGFDPTNGCLAGLDHVRVASGRNYRDATPTSGTLYQGGAGTETLAVDVKVEVVPEDEVAEALRALRG